MVVWWRCRRLTWEDATDRLLQAAEISAEEWPTGFRAAKDTALWRFYRPFTGLEALQQVLGAFACGTHFYSHYK